MFIQKVIFFLVAIIIAVNGMDFSYAHDGEDDEWNPVSAGPLTTWTAGLCGKGKFVLQPFLFYNRTRGSFNAEGRYNSMSGDDRKYQFQEQFFMQYGLADNLEIDALGIYQENFAKQNNNKAHTNGPGDSYLFLRYCAIEDKGLSPHATGVFQLKLPTGKYQNADADKLGTDLMGAASGGGSYDLGYGIILSKKIKPFVLHADAIYSFPQKRKVDGVKTEYGRYLNYDFGAEYFFAEGFNLMLELNGFSQQDKKQDSLRIPASDIHYFNVSSGIGWSNNRIQTLLAYQRTLAGTNTDANDSAVFTFVYNF